VSEFGPDEIIVS